MAEKGNTFSVAAKFFTGVPEGQEVSEASRPSSFQPVRSLDSNEPIVVDLPLSEFHYYKGCPELAEDYPFASQPYKIREDSRDFIELMASVEDVGQLQNALGRPDPEGGIELVAGHRRHRIHEILGRPTLRCEIRGMSDLEAAKIINDSNIYRDDLLPSEKAWAYRLKYEASKRQGARTDLTSRQNGAKLSDDGADLTSRHYGAKLGDDEADLTSRHYGVKLSAYRADKELAKKVKASARTIQRYIRLTYLIPELLDMVDLKKINIDAGEELSHLKPSEQKDLLDYIIKRDQYPSLTQSQNLRQASANGDWNLTVLKVYMTQTRPESNKASIRLENLDAYWQQKTPKEVEAELLCFANVIPKLRQFTALFPENLSPEAFAQKLTDMADRANRKREERQISTPTR